MLVPGRAAGAASPHFVGEIPARVESSVVQRRDCVGPLIVAISAADIQVEELLTPAIAHGQIAKVDYPAWIDIGVAVPVVVRIERHLVEIVLDGHDRERETLFVVRDVHHRYHLFCEERPFVPTRVSGKDLDHELPGPKTAREDLQGAKRRAAQDTVAVSIADVLRDGVFEQRE